MPTKRNAAGIGSEQVPCSPEYYGSPMRRHVLSATIHVRPVQRQDQGTVRRVRRTQNYKEMHRTLANVSPDPSLAQIPAIAPTLAVI